MASKDFVLDGDLAVTVYKRKGNRSLRLSVSPTGTVRVSIPAWAPYKVGLDFVRSRGSWIRNQPRQSVELSPGQAIGKAHHLEFVAIDTATKASARLKGSVILVSYPVWLTTADTEVQTVALEACVRALRVQAKQLLPQRLQALSAANGYTYKSVQVKRLKSRWGSCDQNANIVLNLFLMQLPWELIDYVLLHELTHTIILRHGPDFWIAMAQIIPNVKQLKKTMRDYHPVLHSIA